MRLRLVAVYAGDAQDEAALHRQFAALRVSGEWFNISPEDALRDIKLAPFVEPEPEPEPELVLREMDGSRREKLRKPGGSLVCALMDAKGLQPEDLVGVCPGIENAMDFGVRVSPRRFVGLAAALGVTHQFLYYGRNFVRTPMGRPA